MSDYDGCIGLQLKLTKNIMEIEYTKYLKPYGISSEQSYLLKFVYDYPGLNQTKIAEGLNKDKTTITRMIDALVKKGKLQRKNSMQDRRAFKIFLTKEAESNMIKVSPLFEENQKELEKIINKKDYETTLKVLNQIQNYYKGLNK